MKKRGGMDLHWKEIGISLASLIVFTALFFIAGRYFFPEFFSTGFFVYTIQPPDFQQQGGFQTLTTTVDKCGYNITQPGEYNLTADLTGCTDYGIKINVSNVTLDCLGHSIVGQFVSDSAGIIVDKSVSNVTIQNCTVYNFTKQIQVNATNSTFQNLVLKGDSAHSSLVGIEIKYGDNITITGSTFENFTKDSDGIQYRKLFNSFIGSNRFNYCGEGISPSFGGVGDESFINNTLMQNNFSYIDQGIWLSGSIENNLIVGNNFYNITKYSCNTKTAIFVENSENDTVENNTFYGALVSDAKGIEFSNQFLWQALGTTVKNNTFINLHIGVSTAIDTTTSITLISNTYQSCEKAIYIENSDYNKIINETINCDKGIEIFGAKGNNITGAEISSKDYGIYLNDTEDILIKDSNSRNSFAGLYSIADKSTTIFSSNFTNNYFGFIAYLSQGMLFNLSNASSNKYGASLIKSKDIEIWNSTFNSNTFDGLVIDLNSTNITVIYSDLKSNSGNGLKILFFSNNNTISNNTITNNAGYGVYFDFYARDNTIQYNDLSSNTKGTNYTGDFCTGNTFTGNTP